MLDKIGAWRVVLGTSFGTILDKIGAWRVPGGGPWDHPGAPWAPDPKKHQKTHFVGSPCWPHVGTFLYLFGDWFFTCFLSLSPSFFLAPKAPAGLNFEGLWMPFGTQSEQIWKSGNYDSVWEWTRKSSFGGSAFQLVLSFSCAGFRDLSFSWFVSWFCRICRICVSIWAPFLDIRASFLTLFSRPQKNEKIRSIMESRRGHLGHISDKGGTKAIQ